MKEYGVWEQVDLRVIGKEDHEFLVPNGKVYGFLHGKVYITDQKNIVVSTSNLDPISRDINSEIGVSFKFSDENAKNLKEMLSFVDFADEMSTQVGSAEYERMLNNPNTKNRVRRLKITQWIVEKLGLLHLL
jgi:putative cardiolipin synthase